MNQVFIVALLAIAATVSSTSVDVQVVAALDVKAYLGKWFQVYTNAFVKNTIERNGFCVTAQYGRGKDGTITVLNSQRTGSPTGPADSIRGVATTPNSCQPGKLLLKLDNVPREGSYWVLALGPKVDGLYQWSIVSDESSTTLFILARNPTTFKTKYEKAALRKAAKLGFVGDNKPVKSYQEKDCLY